MGGEHGQGERIKKVEEGVLDHKMSVEVIQAGFKTDLARVLDEAIARQIHLQSLRRELFSFARKLRDTGEEGEVLVDNPHYVRLTVSLGQARLASEMAIRSLNAVLSGEASPDPSEAGPGSAQPA